MNLLTISEGWLLLGCFAVAMFGIVVCIKPSSHADSFFAADRQVGPVRGALSIAAAWVWAPAIFICAQQSYSLGLPGIFWFTAPNILCFFIYAPLASRVRRQLPQGYTLPEYLAERFKDYPAAHIAFVVLFLGYQLGAIVINTLAGGGLLNAISGADENLAIISIAVIALSYTFVSGLRASILTDVVQMSLMLLISMLLVPWAVHAAGGWHAVQAGLGGVTDTHRELMNPWIAFTLGIPMSLGLIAGPIGDQMFWQRTFAARKDSVTKTFIYGGLIFSVIPVSLSFLGFIGASMARSGQIAVSDPQLVGPLVISALLPKYALYAFTIMALAGLCSTMDSACCAISSLCGIDLFRRYISPRASEKEILTASRTSMVLIVALGTAIALLKPKLLWVFLIYGALAAAGMFPTAFALLSKKLTGKAACLAVSLSLVIGLPYSVYANINEDPIATVIAALLSTGIGLTICLINPGSGIENKTARQEHSVAPMVS